MYTLSLYFLVHVVDESDSLGQTFVIVSHSFVFTDDSMIAAMT